MSQLVAIGTSDGFCNSADGFRNSALLQKPSALGFRNSADVFFVTGACPALPYPFPWSKRIRPITPPPLPLNLGGQRRCRWREAPRGKT